MKTKKRLSLNPIKNTCLFCMASIYLIATGCSRDEGIKGAIRIKAKDNLYFAGVMYSVDHSIVTLTGKCPTKESRDKVALAVKDIGKVDSVINQITLGAVSIDNSLVLKQKLDSVLVKYPQIVADVNKTKVRLTGRLPSKNEPELFATVRGLLDAQVSSTKYPFSLP